MYYGLPLAYQIVTSSKGDMNWSRQLVIISLTQKERKRKSHGIDGHRVLRDKVGNSLQVKSQQLS